MAAPRGPVRWLHLLGLGRPRPEESVRLEIEHHLSETADRLMAEGWPPEAARREAERRFGNRRRYRPRMARAERRMMTRERWDRWTAAGWQLLATTVRTVRRSPALVAGVVLTMGLGVGANATMYGIVDRLLLRPPEHIVDPGGVRRVLVTRPDLFTRETRSSPSHAYPDYDDLKAHSGMSVAAFSPSDERTIGSGGGASRARSALASAEFFPVLGVQPRLGRFFTPEESSIGAPLTAVLSEKYWQSAYGADSSIVGRSIEIDGNSVPVVGVAPAGFTGVDLTPVDIWLPLEAAYSMGSTDCISGRHCHFMEVVARLAHGISIESAEAEATRLHLNGRREQIERGEYFAEATVTLAPLISAAGPDPSAESRVAAWLAGVSILVLLIACANVTNLLLARETTRRREIVVRLALGAGRGRLVGHAVAESVFLALAGGALALAIARWGGRLARSVLLPGIEFPDSGLGAQVVLYTLLVSIVAGLLASAGPALTAGRTDLTCRSDAGYAHTGAHSRIRGFLTATQAALSVVLLIGAGLFVRSLTELRGLDLGLDTDRLLMVDFQLATSGGTADANLRNEVYGDAMTMLAALPEVEAVAGTATPFGMGYSPPLRIPERDSIPRLPGGGPYIFPVTPGYFETAGLEITSGRAFDRRDGPDADPVTVVSETMARVLWTGEAPVGRCMLIGRNAKTCSTIVGVVDDAARGGYQDDPYMAYYVPIPQSRAMGLPPTFGAPNGVYIRARGRAADARAAVAASLRSISPQVRWARVETLRERLDPGARSWTLGATMFTTFGLLALVLAAVGLYSVLAFDVAQRTRELGIRAALGARRARLLRSVLWHGLRLAAIGIATGLAIAYLAAPYAQDLLFEVSPRDPLVLASVALTLLAVSVLASLAPGLRATRVDPVAALKAD